VAYLKISQIKELYDISDKTIRRLYEKNKSNPEPPIKSRSQGYKNKKGKWVISEDFLESRFADKRKEPDQAETKSDPKQTKSEPSQTESQALLKTIEVLQEQLKEKDKQLERYDQKLDQQQQLTAQLQNQLLIASPSEPIRADITSQPPKPQTQPKKAVRKPKKSSQSKQKAPKPKKRWWQRG
jgi:chromosome segregation ATPase